MQKSETRRAAPQTIQHRSDADVLQSILAGADMSRRQIIGEPDEPQVVTIALAKAGALDDIARLLPASSKTPAARFLAGFIRCARLDKQNGKGNLVKCSLASILEALKMAAQVDVVPGDGRAYLIPYGQECQFHLGVHGLRDVLRRSPDVLDINDQVVYEGDEFEAVLEGPARGVRHVRGPLGEHGKIVGAYATVTLRQQMPDRPLVEVMDRDEIEQVRAASKNTSESGPWGKWFGEMARKAVLRRLAKRVPMRPDDAAALAAMDAVEFFTDEAASAGQRAIRSAPARATIQPTAIRASANPNRGHDATMPEPAPKASGLSLRDFAADQQKAIMLYAANARGLDRVQEIEQWVRAFDGDRDDLLALVSAAEDEPDSEHPRL
jgi:phage RecT family recombinase